MDASGCVRDCEVVNPLPSLAGVVPLCRPGESSDDCADADADESEGMDCCERVHKTEVDAGDGHLYQSVGALIPTRI